MPRLEFFDRDISAALLEDLGAPGLGDDLARFARAGLADYLRTLEDKPGVTRIVNGRIGADEDSVILPGPIVYSFSWWAQILEYALAFLHARSPSKSGDYRAGFFVLADGREVQPPQFGRIAAGAEVIIGNDRPYSRKLDVQMSGGRSIRVSVPPGIFADGASAIRAKFVDLVTVKRFYTISYRGQYTLKTGPKRGKPVNSPAIVITPKD